MMMAAALKSVPPAAHFIDPTLRMGSQGRRGDLGAFWAASGFSSLSRTRIITLSLT